MGQIRDYQCTYDSSADIIPQLIGRLGLPVPQVYQDREYMARLAKAVKAETGQPFCILPFCHTLEGEALGGCVNFGDEKFGPRAKTFICRNLTEVLELSAIDVSTGRVRQTLEAAKILCQEGEDVVWNLSGPFTILNVLMDSARLFRGFRKEPESVEAVFQKLERELLTVIRAARDCGVSMFSYADPAGSVNLIGPQMAEQVVELFTHPFLKKVQEELEEDALIFLCPKTAYALTGTQRAELISWTLKKPASYYEACLANRGNIRFVGQICMKKGHHLLKNGVLQEIKI